MIDGTLVYIHDHAAAGSDNRGMYGIVLSSKLAWATDEHDDTLVVNVLVPTTGTEIGFYDWQLEVINDT